MNNEDFQQLKALASSDVFQQVEWVNADWAETHFGSEAEGKFVEACSPATILALIARIESLAADAERYRFRKRVLSDGGCVMWAAKRCMIYKDGHVLGAGESEDEAIDAAIAKEKV